MLTETLKELCALPGVSSCEDAVRDYIRAITAPYADRSYTDTLGNLIIEKKGVSPGTKKVMLVQIFWNLQICWYNDKKLAKL